MLALQTHHPELHKTHHRTGSTTGALHPQQYSCCCFQAGDMPAGSNDSGFHGLLRTTAGPKAAKATKQRQQQQLALEEAAQQLPFMPMGPAPDASAGCG